MVDWNGRRLEFQSQQSPEMVVLRVPAESERPKLPNFFRARVTLHVTVHSPHPVQPTRSQSSRFQIRPRKSISSNANGQPRVILCVGASGANGIVRAVAVTCQTSDHLGDRLALGGSSGFNRRINTDSLYRGIQHGFTLHYLVSIKDLKIHTRKRRLAC
jgi:hypothetical protein